MCVCVCLSCVRAGLQGHPGPWFPAQDEWAPLHHCLGQQRSRLRLVMFEGEKDLEGELTGDVGLVFSTPGRGQGSSPSASILLQCMTGLGIQD